MTAGPLLAGIASPQDLKALPAERLPELAQQIRTHLVDSVCGTGGHLGPNLGVVELTLALHRVFESPKDRILFDTGHQSYVHKLLTGRQDLSTLRRGGGLSGYPSRAESPHDVVENSHASTALSYADGLAKARQVLDEGSAACIVAVIGDGAMTGGLAWEALNNLGAAQDRPVVVVLNDNARSYAGTVGGLAEHLGELRTTHEPRTLFRALGFAYLGPVDGHDVGATEAALGLARDVGTPVVVHVVTRKGAGYAPAEADEADRFHGVGTLDPVTGRPTTAPSGPTWTDVFAQEIVDVADERPDVVGITAAMAKPVGLDRLARAHPKRVFDVGIAEQHAVTSAAGLAAGGLHPVVAVYATFLNRAFDQVLMDVALHRAGVTFVLDRAGVTGEDGASHHGMWDMALLSLVPGLRLAAPRDGGQLRRLLREALDVDDAPTVVRFPKGTAPAELPATGRHGRVDLLTRGPATARRDLLVVAVGPMARPALDAAARLERNGFSVTVADPRWVLPVPAELTELAARHRAVAVVEDNLRTGGVGAAVGLALQDAGLDVPSAALGLPRAFLPQGRRPDLLDQLGLGVECLAEDLTRLIGRATGRPRERLIAS